MTLELIQVIIMACHIHTNVADNRGMALSKLTGIENMCVMGVGVCMSNQEIANHGHWPDGGEGLALLNCVINKRDWKP